MLIIRYPGNRDTLCTLNANAFSRINYNNSSFSRAFGRITAATPNGALGGMIATLSASYECDIYAGTGATYGIFLNDAAGNPFENQPAIAAGKLSVMIGPGSVYETDLYETVNEAGTALAVAWTAALGLPLYASDFGLLTTENTGSGIVGLVTKVPTTTNPFLGFKSAI